MRIAELRALGMSEADARADALRRFGDPTELRDSSALVLERRARWARMIGWSNDWTQDVRFAVRQFRNAPAFTAIAVLTLALGIGANATIFSVLDQVFLRAPAGVSAPDRVRRIWLQQPIGRSASLDISTRIDYHTYRAIAGAVDDQALVALYTTKPGVSIGRTDASATATVAYATASYFSALGVHPSIGRAFTDAEADVHGASAVVVVSDAFWRKHLGAERSALGQVLTVDGHDFMIIGIGPPTFSGIDLQETELWLPLGTMPTRDTYRVSFWNSSVVFFSMFARVPPGGNEQLLERRATAAYRTAPVTDWAPSASGEILLRSIIDARGPGPRPRELSIGIRLSVVAVLILLITASNIVNLFLARAVARRREIAVRLALGINRARLVRLFVVESVLLSLAAGSAALLVTQLTGGLLRSTLVPGIQFARGPLQWAVVGFTISLSILTGIAAGFITAAHGSKADLTKSLKAGIHNRDGGRSLVSTVLVGAQTALSVILLVGAVLFVQSLLNVERLRIGFDTPRLAFASTTLPQGEQPDTMGFAEAMRSIGDRLRAAPSVEAIAFARDEPMTWPGRIKLYTDTDSSEAPGHQGPAASTVSADYFKAIGLSFISGAPYSDETGSATNAIVVNETLVRSYWPDRNPIGQCIRLQKQDSPCLVVAGVVKDAIYQRLIEEPTPQLYLPLFGSIRGKRPPNVMVIRADPARLPFAMAEASRALRDAFPRGEPSVRRMADRLAPQYRPWQLGAALFGAFGLLALVVATLGVYSSVSYAVTQRVHELGVRIALGASVRDVMRHVVGRGVQPVVIGGMLGAGLALASARLIASLLYGVQPWNPVVLIAVVLTLLAVAMAAACIPAWRATRIDPVRAMMAD